MLPRDVLRQLRHLRVRARRAVEGYLGGEYHSVFKGMGLTFEEVREYQPGDDIRTIDWNVTARMGLPYVKRFREERERTLLLALDVSASLRFGSGDQPKREIVAELAAVLAFSALVHQDRVGLLLFTDRIERFVPPGKGARHILRIVRDILFFQPAGRKTALRVGFDAINRLLKRRAIVFLFSDFADQEYEKPFQGTAQRHELIAVRVTDPCEQALPDFGLLHVVDAESERVHVIDTASPEVRDAFARAATEGEHALRQLARGSGADFASITTDGRHLEALVAFLRQREHRLRRAGR